MSIHEIKVPKARLEKGAPVADVLADVDATVSYVDVEQGIVAVETDDKNLSAVRSALSKYTGEMPESPRDKAKKQREEALSSAEAKVAAGDTEGALADVLALLRDEPTEETP